MSPNIATVLTFIPTSIWSMLKAFVKPETIITFDTPFKISTKYTPALLIVLMCLSFANQFFRNVEIDCTSSTDMGVGVNPGRGGGYGGPESELNNYCWNYETFLVAKALLPNMREKVSYPGVWSYVRGDDELIKQKYYKFLWFGIAKIAVVAFLPLFLWKLKGITNKIKFLTQVGPATEEGQAALRAAHFIENAGFNQGLAVYYFFCKVLALLSPLFNWLYLSGFIGKQFRFYGVDVLIFITDGGDPWPNPMDALFPKMAKCEWAKYGYTGDLELKAAQCQLPMNNFTQWSFFFLWWWIIFILLLNGFHFIYFLFYIFPTCRNCRYSRYISKVFREDIESARTALTPDGKETQTRKTKQVISMRISYGDWLVLYFLEKNLMDFQFRSFIRKLAVTTNPVLQATKPGQNYNDAITANAPPGAQPSEPNAEQLAKPSNTMGFMDPMLKGAPPNYESCDESDSSLSTSEGQGEDNEAGKGLLNIPPTGPKMGFTFELPPPAQNPTSMHPHPPANGQLQQQSHRPRSGSGHRNPFALAKPPLGRKPLPSNQSSHFPF